ncbi:MAG TPA: class A beta-lactamase-related serine hydrolase [bacterium (Candidatus Stahlbacteria)]|nr:class A beta-lactamase-related serine hydrolase [Candidatus Stahlbacteria bacterium]
MVDECVTSLRGLIKAGKVPGGALYIYDRGEELFFYDGYAQIVPAKRPISRDTLYDIASLTKVVATAPAVMRLCEDERIRIDQPIGDLLEEFRNRPNHRITIRQLLYHSSGLKPWYPTYAINQEERLPYLADLKPDFVPGTDVQYSCLNYIILGVMIERVSGKDLRIFTRENIFKPLKMHETDFGPVDKNRAVTTEVGDEHERKLAEPCLKNDFRWRDYPITGEVHDGNAYYGFNGLAGNAGLFSTIGDLAIFVKSLLNYRFPLKKKTIEEMERPLQDRGVGWIIKGDKTLFHAGFTGCGIWLNRAEGWAVVFLSNLIHPRVVLGLGDQVRERIIRTFRAARS